jgi:hypothetical protein
VRPTYRKGEVLRIARLKDHWQPEDRWVLDTEAVVNDYVGPTPEDDGWELSTWVHEPEPAGLVLWVFAEEELESTGFIERANGRGTKRVPLQGVGPPAELRDELHFRLITAVTDESDATRIAASAEREVQRIASAEPVDARVLQNPDAPHIFELLLTLEPRDPFQALQRLFSSGLRGWTAIRDDGWSFHAWWSRPEETDSVLLAPEVERAEVVLMPWDHSRRDVAKKRTMIDAHIATSRLSQQG